MTVAQLLQQRQQQPQRLIAAAFPVMVATLTTQQCMAAAIQATSIAKKMIALLEAPIARTIMTIPQKMANSQ